MWLIKNENHYLYHIIFFFSNSASSQQDTVFNNNGSYTIGKYKHHKKTGKWKTYNSKDELIEKSKYKFSIKHGKSFIYKNDKCIKEKYYYNINKTDRVINGKKY